MSIGIYHYDYQHPQSMLVLWRYNFLSPTEQGCQLQEKICKRIADAVVAARGLQQNRDKQNDTLEEHLDVLILLIQINLVDIYGVSCARNYGSFQTSKKGTYFCLDKLTLQEGEGFSFCDVLAIPSSTAYINV